MPHREAYHRAEELIKALNGDGKRVVHGLLVAIIFAKANDIDRENDLKDQQIREWEIDL